MIRYALKCEFDHDFEAWFSNSDAYDDQRTRHLIECPHCGTVNVGKAIMAPMVRTSETVENRQMSAQKALMEAAHKIRKHVETNFDYVGDSFAQEARDMHEGTTPERPIYGEASGKDIKALVDDGIPVAPLPAAPLPAASSPDAKPNKRLN
ncbi:DUF1178 family protein [Asticcacaulis tiandongensis]|uniref:DUF1178 family protein n=1 Tax=Asticcacaulis tiandongensis TaxID=2565365 RepID=UPI0011267E44|nr:DUF1178 family protein [Asticcacaulis tiandongensis]